jgi:hypothetical protein
LPPNTTSAAAKIKVAENTVLFITLSPVSAFKRY